jgi:DNA-binding NarL/FixJ family response regulator
MDIRCLIVDDSPEFLVAAEQTLIRQGIGVVGVARDSAQAMASVEALRPDVVLVDVGLGAESGFALARRIAEAARNCKRAVNIILISTHDREDLQSLIADSPAAGYLEKSALSAQAIRNLLQYKRTDPP